MYDVLRPGIAEVSSALREPSLNQGPKRVDFAGVGPLEARGRLGTDSPAPFRGAAKIFFPKPEVQVILTISLRLKSRKENLPACLDSWNLQVKPAQSLSVLHVQFGYQYFINLQTHPCIGGGITDLFFVKYVCFPIGSLCSF